MSRTRMVAEVIRNPMLLPAERTTFASAVVDMGALGADGLVAFVLAAIKTTGTSPVLTAKLQHCDTDDGQFADVTDGAWTAGVGATGVIEALVMDPQNLKRYVQAVGTVGGSNTPTLACALWVEYMPKVHPMAEVPDLLPE